jgi:hypothetical protein
MKAWKKLFYGTLINLIIGFLKIKILEKDKD